MPHQPEISTFAVFCAGLLFGLNLGADEILAESAFSSLTEEEALAIEPTLRETHFRDGYPRLYRRHRILKIDTEALRLRLHNDWTARENGADASGVAIPLFEDLVITIDVESWREGNFGIVGAYGTPRNKSTFPTDFAAHFDANGRLDVAINLEDLSFLIERVRDNEHYLILEMERNKDPID